MMETTNLSKIKREEMLKFLEELKKTHSDDESIRAFNEIENQLTEKKFGLVFEEHKEKVDEMLKNNIPVFCADESRKICKDKNMPYNFILEGDNLQALYLLEKTHRGKIDCIYIDPPYNSGSRDWKYNNDFVDNNDKYRHSKWLSMMKERLLIAKKLLNQKHSVLICTIDEKEYLHLGCLLEELFPNAGIQMISSVINPSGVARGSDFARTDEYLFFVKIGNIKPIPLNLSDEWTASNSKKPVSTNPTWRTVRRRGADDLRENSPRLFYPIYVEKQSGKILSCGESLPLNKNRDEIISTDKNIEIVWPLKPHNVEGRWQLSQQELKDRLEQGYVRAATRNEYGWSLSYLAKGEIKKVLDGTYEVLARHGANNELVLSNISNNNLFIPGTQWRISSHNAREQGSVLLKNMLGTKEFDYPKSLYAVHDAIKFFVADKPDAIILDFFAGSGTTMHAVNLLNSEDEGKRKCIMVTNNEVSEKEAKILKQKGYKKGDKEWEDFGIAKRVTWPRTFCSINGIDINNKPLAGNYLINDLPMSKGFNSNVKFFKCDWTPRKPENYLLSNVLCLHVKEMIELENAVEIDDEKNVIIYNRDDFKKYLLDENKYNKVENLWINQNIIFDSNELKILNRKGFKYIPREYFGQELKEAAE